MGLLIDPTQLVGRHYLKRWQENLKAKRLSQERKRGFRWTAVVLANPASHIWGKKMNFSFSRGLIKVAYHYFFILQSYRPASPWIFTKRVQYKF